MSDELKLEGVNVKGYGNIPKLVMQDTNLTIEAKSIYAYFCSFTGGGVNKAFPSISKICKDLGISENRLLKHRKLLIDNGYVSIERVRNEDGNGWSRNIYTIHDFVHIQNKGIQNEGVGNVGIQNKGTNKNSTNNNNNNNNNNNKTAPKKPYGEFKNVNLTDKELDKLKINYPDYENRIEILSTYLEQIGKDKYKSHYATIQKWARSEKNKPKPKPKPKPKQKTKLENILEDMYGD